MIAIENRDDYITMTRLLRKSRLDNISVKINGSGYLWTRKRFMFTSLRSIHNLHFDAYVFVSGCAIVAKSCQSLKKEQLNEARNFVETTRLLVNLRKDRGDA